MVHKVSVPLFFHKVSVPLFFKVSVPLFLFQSECPFVFPFVFCCFVLPSKQKSHPEGWLSVHAARNLAGQMSSGLLERVSNTNNGVLVVSASGRVTSTL